MHMMLRATQAGQHGYRLLCVAGLFQKLPLVLYDGVSSDNDVRAQSIIEYLTCTMPRGKTCIVLNHALLADADALCRAVATAYSAPLRYCVWGKFSSKSETTTLKCCRPICRNNSALRGEADASTIDDCCSLGSTSTSILLLTRFYYYNGVCKDAQCNSLVSILKLMPTCQSLPSLQRLPRRMQSSKTG